ncbi:hypothetical protein quinque_010906 [Culex quinquefasciatus]
MAKIRNVFKKHLIPNLESKCRLCLSDKAIVQSIFQCESKETTDTLVEKIFECTAIMLSKDFDFPSPICEDCAIKLDEFLLFRAKCLRSNEIYRFNKLHKARLFSAGPKAPQQSNGSVGGLDGDGEGPKEHKPPDESPKDQQRHSLPVTPQLVIPEEQQVDKEAVVITTSSSSEGANVTVVTDVIQEEFNGKDEETVTLDGRKSTDLSVIDDADVTTVSEPLPSRSTPRPITDAVAGFTFPLASVEDMDALERRVRTCPPSRDRFITLLKTLKTHDTSLSDTYQRIFTDALLIHYNYDGISPKYNKRPLKNLAIFTDCMLAAWDDHMDAAMVREAIIEAVKKSHNRYNQCYHRKRARQTSSYEWL